MSEWRFRRMLPDKMNIDPIENEFFSTEALDSMSDALVRESIQNSLDARAVEAVVRVRFAFGSVGPSVSARYFSGLGPHLGAVGSGLARLPDLTGELDYLVVEDFGTRGLQGDPLQSEDQALDESTPRNDFYYFWRNIGRSRKHTSDLGRWGLGKTVFPAASRINSFLAFTVRADDRRNLLMGQSVLRIHKVEDTRHYPYGYFGVFDGDFAEPVEDITSLERIRADLGFARRDEPGLSVIVPWPDADLTPESVAASVMRHYFTPILAGSLVVEVVNNQSPERLDAVSLPEIVPVTEVLPPEEASRLGSLVALTRFGQRLVRASFIRLPAPPESSAPRWETDCLRDAPDDIGERFEAGRPLAFRVPVWVKAAERDAVLSEFDVLLERDASLSRADEHFLREGVTVAGVRGNLAKGIRAMVIVRDPPLTALLGDAENPAHTEWQERSPKFKNHYRHGPSTLRYVRNAPRAIARALTRPALGRNERLLEQLFSLEVPTENEIIEAARRSDDEAVAGKTLPAGDVDVRGGSGRSFAIAKTEGGFRLSGAGNGSYLGSLAVQVAYEVRRGNPFARYQPPDFEMSEPPIEISARGATVTRRQANLLVVHVDEPGFELSVVGFDPRRDIRVRAVAVEPPT